MDLHFFLKSFVKNEILMPLDLKKNLQPTKTKPTNKQKNKNKESFKDLPLPKFKHF